MNEMLEEKQLYALVVEKETSDHVIDADWQDDYGLAVVLKRGTEQVVELNGRAIDTSFIQKSVSHIRWIDADKILLAEDKIMIIDGSGQLLQSFDAGVAIEGIVTGKEGIWVSYFDEGVGTGIADEGLRLFDLTGNTLFRYHSDLLDRPSIFDCYGLCKGKGATVWILPYTDFPLVEVNPEARTAHTYTIPEALHGSAAICVRGKYAYFFSPYQSSGLLYQLEIGTQEPRLLGKNTGRMRGLGLAEDSHFLAVSDREVKLCKVLNNEEFDY